MRFEEYIVELPSERFCPLPMKVGAAACACSQRWLGALASFPRDVSLGALAPAPRDGLGAHAPAPSDGLGAPEPVPRDVSFLAFFVFTSFTRSSEFPHRSFLTQFSTSHLFLPVARSSHASSSLSVFTKHCHLRRGPYC